MPRGIPRNQSVQQKILHRLKITRGHLNKVIQMVSDGDYCIDIVHQSIAVQKSLKKIDTLIMKNHIETCVYDSIKKGDGKEAIQEIISVLKKAE